MTEEDFHKQPTLPGSSFSEGFSKEVPGQIGPYKIESLLEKGGMSILYLGTRPETKEPTTVKVLLPKFLSKPDVVKRFLDEAEIISMADHPNIVKLYGYGEWEKGLYIAMEFIEGISLRQYLLRKPLTLKHALEIILDIAYALCHLHAHGVIHRDLKPENILITDRGVIKVIDFGIAQLLTEAKKTAEAKPRIIGTPIYMSPEQRDRPDSVGVQSDIYSLGIIAYELILGKLSHGRIHLSLMPRGMQKILSRALQPRPEDRHQDMVDFIREVNAYLQSATFEKDSPPKDRLTKISEGLIQAETYLVPQSPPPWHFADICFNRPAREVPEGIALCYLSFPDNRNLIFMAESKVKGAAGIIGASMIYGMVQPLSKSASGPEQFVEKFKMLSPQNVLPVEFNFNILLLDASEGRAELLLSEGSTMWHLPSLQEGAAFSWNSGDALFLTAYQCRSQQEESYFKTSILQFLKENFRLSPEQLASTASRKIKSDPHLEFLKETINLFTIKRIA